VSFDRAALGLVEALSYLPVGCQFLAILGVSRSAGYWLCPWLFFPSDAGARGGEERRQGSAFDGVSYPCLGSVLTAYLVYFPTRGFVCRAVSPLLLILVLRVL